MIDPEKVSLLISECLHRFYERRKTRLANLQLRELLSKKNPYLYKARGIQKSSQIIPELLADFITASDETIFGDEFFEPIARAVSGGTASQGQGVDITIETETTVKVIAMKSGPNPQNASATIMQGQEFASLAARIKKLGKAIDTVRGHGYGRKQSPATGKRGFRHSSGQKLWEEITGDPDFYQKIIYLMKAEEIEKHRTEYTREYEKAENRFLKDFLNAFSYEDGLIDWEKVLDFNSGADRKKWLQKRKGKKAKSDELPFEAEEPELDAN